MTRRTASSHSRNYLQSSLGSTTVDVFTRRHNFWRSPRLNQLKPSLVSGELSCLLEEKGRVQKGQLLLEHRNNLRPKHLAPSSSSQSNASRSSVDDSLSARDPEKSMSAHQGFSQQLRGPVHQARQVRLSLSVPRVLDQTGPSHTGSSAAWRRSAPEAPRASPVKLPLRPSNCQLRGPSLRTMLGTLVVLFCAS